MSCLAKSNIMLTNLPADVDCYSAYKTEEACAANKFCQWYKCGADTLGAAVSCAFVADKTTCESDPVKAVGCKWNGTGDKGDTPDPNGVQDDDDDDDSKTAYLKIGGAVVGGALVGYLAYRLTSRSSASSS